MHNKKVFSIPLLAAIFLISSCKDSNPPESPDKGPEAKLEIPEHLNKVSRENLNDDRAYEVFAWSFSDWQPDSLHWNAPSTFRIKNDGSWVLYAQRLANMRRTGGVFDTGHVYTPLIGVTYYNGQLVNERCSGVVVHSANYSFQSLRYKQERPNVSVSGTDSRFAQALSEIECASVTRHWR